MMTKAQRSIRAYRPKIKKSKQGTHSVFEGDPTSQKNWKLATGWYVGIDVYPTRDAELADPERLRELMPGAIMPESQAQAIQIIKDGITRSQAAKRRDNSSEGVSIPE